MITQFGRRCYQFWYADTPYSIFAIFVFIGSISGFWPFVAGYHNTILELSPLRASLNSTENIVASTVLITLAVPLAIDGILDFVVSRLMDRKKAKETTDILNIVERTFIYSGLLIFPCCTFVSRQYADLGLLTLCCSRFQYCIIYGGCFMSVSRIAPHCFSPRLSMLGLGAYYISQKLITYAFINIEDLSSRNFHFYYTISNALMYFTFAIVILMVVHWIWLNYLSHCFSKQSSSAIATMDRSSSPRNNHINDDVLSLKSDIQTLNNMFISIMVVIGVVSLIILLANSESAVFINYLPLNLALVHMAISVFALGLLIYHLRKFRSDALLRLHALVNKKASLLKYVHELYEPISTIYKAQKHMIEELGEVSGTNTNRSIFYSLQMILFRLIHLLTNDVLCCCCCCCC